MVQIIDRAQSKIFTIEEANALLPLIYRLTEEYAKKVKYLVACLEALPDKKSDRALDIQNEINENIAKWQSKLERLGARPKGLWLADFDYGHGYFCWKYPETQILYKHGYQDGFTGRMLISNKEDINAHCPSPNQP